MLPPDEIINQTVMANLRAAATKRGVDLDKLLQEAEEEAKVNLTQLAQEFAVLARTIKSLRQSRKMSVRTLATRSNVPMRMLLSAERGNCGAQTIPDLFRIAHALGCGIETLLRGVGGAG